MFHIDLQPMPLDLVLHSFSAIIQYRSVITCNGDMLEKVVYTLYKLVVYNLIVFCVLFYSF
jgi:hypothetical protein